jgi:hypothetical protein
MRFQESVKGTKRNQCESEMEDDSRAKHSNNQDSSGEQTGLDTNDKLIIYKDLSKVIKIIF